MPFGSVLFDFILDGFGDAADDLDFVRVRCLHPFDQSFRCLLDGLDCFGFVCHCSSPNISFVNAVYASVALPFGS